MTQTASRNDISSPWLGFWLGSFSSLALIALFWLGSELWGQPFVPFDLFDWLARTLPGWLIGSVIGGMVAVIRGLQTILPIGNISDAAKLTEQGMALGLVLLAGGGLGAWLGWQAQRAPGQLSFYGQLAGLGLLAAVLLIEIALGKTLPGLSMLWLALLLVGWGWGLAALLARAQRQSASQPQLSRRQFLRVTGAGLSAAALGSWGLAQLFGGDKTLPASSQTAADALDPTDPFGSQLTSGPAASPSAETLAARPGPVPGTRPELTSVADFYRIDINSLAPQVAADNWRVQVHGLVANPLQLSLSDIRSMPAQTQILTMQCISNPIGGDLTSSTRWTGVPLPYLLQQVAPQAGVAGAHITAADGFDEFVTLEDLQDQRCLLVYAMNEAPLPQEHGYPLRIYIPNRYGMKQPKWIMNIEFVAERLDGYWVRRGWDREAIPHTVSVVDTVVVERDEGPNGMVHTGGIAWAGGRGISKVEVQINNQGWQAAQLLQPELSPLNWTLWKFAWPYARGRHIVSVRAYDGQGQLQELTPRGTIPSGATGIHSATVDL